MQESDSNGKISFLHVYNVKLYEHHSSCLFQAVLSSADSSGWGFFVRWVGLCITNKMSQPIANVITPCVDKATVDDILEQFLKGKLPKLR